MVSINVSDDTACSLFRDMLAEDYRRLAKDIASARLDPTLDEVDHGDLDDWIRWHAAIGQLMDYYFSDDEAKRIIGNG